MYIISHHYVVLSELFCLYFLIIIKKQKKTCLYRNTEAAFSDYLLEVKAQGLLCLTWLH